MNLSDIRKILPFRISKNLSDTFITYRIIKHEHDYTIDYDVYLPSIGKNLQRPFCWSLQQKRELILSIIKGIDIRKITVIVYAENTLNDKQTYKIIDGKQRLSTLLSFFKNEFTIELFGLEYYFNDLPADIKYVIEIYDMIYDCAYEYKDNMISDKDKIEWFKLINFAGTPQEIEHLNSLTAS